MRALTVADVEALHNAGAGYSLWWDGSDVIVTDDSPTADDAMYLMPWDAAWLNQWDGDWTRAVDQLNTILTEREKEGVV